MIPQLARVARHETAKLMKVFGPERPMFHHDPIPIQHPTQQARIIPGQII